MNLIYIFISLFVILTAFLEMRYTNRGINWYNHIQKPFWTPSKNMLVGSWSVLFLLTAISAYITLNTIVGVEKYFIAGLYCTNAVLTFLWSYIFFKEHRVFIALFETGALCASLLALIIAVWSVSYVAALFLLPYFVWASFTAIFTHKVWKLNSNWKWNSI